MAISMYRDGIADAIASLEAAWEAVPDSALCEADGHKYMIILTVRLRLLAILEATPA